MARTLLEQVVKRRGKDIVRMAANHTNRVGFGCICVQSGVGKMDYDGVDDDDDDGDDDADADV